MGLHARREGRTSCSSVDHEGTRNAFVRRRPEALHDDLATRYHRSSAVKGARSAGRKTVAPKDGALRIPTPPPSSRTRCASRPSTCGPRPPLSGRSGAPRHCAPSPPPRCLPGAGSLGHDRWVVFSQPPQVTFFVRSTPRSRLGSTTQARTRPRPTSRHGSAAGVSHFPASTCTSRGSSSPLEPGASSFPMRRARCGQAGGSHARRSPRTQAPARRKGFPRKRRAPLRRRVIA